MVSALEGIRIIDLSRTLPGPYCTMILGDMGAEVIKVEEVDPRWVRSTYSLGVRVEDNKELQDKLRVYRFVDRNKKSISLNLKTESGRGIYYKLVEKADVVVDEFRPGTAQRLHIDYDTLKMINSRLIYCALSGYGQNGPYRSIPGHNPNYIAMAGILGITGTSKGQHVLPGIAEADLGAGALQAAVGILCALMARQKTSRGQFVDVAMFDGLVSWLAAQHGAAYFATGRQPRLGERPSHVYRTKDGKYICVAPAEPWFWQRLCEAIGLEEYVSYHDQVGYFEPATVEKREEVISRMTEAFRTKTRDEWFCILQDADVPVAPVYDFNEVFSDPQVLARDMMLEIDDPSLGKVKQVGIATKLSATPGVIKRLPPKRGQDTEEILFELGFTEAQIDELRRAGVVE